MDIDWEDVFRRWSKPSSDTEQEKSDNAERMIGDAIRECPILAKRTIEVFAQGSYRNNTNVRQDSDVDICVRCMDTCGYDFSEVPGMTLEGAGMIPASYLYPQFKSEIGAALVRKFGEAGVSRGSKAFDVHANGYRVDADVVAVMEYRYYFRNYLGHIDYHSGTELYPDSGNKIINWPHQHHENGVKKNIETSYRFKYITRIIKRLRNRMDDEGIEAAKPIPSYLIECLAWNVPNEDFGNDKYAADVQNALAHLYSNMATDKQCGQWLEVNGIKYLFHWAQPWTRQRALEFIGAAWNYIGFK